MTPETEILEVEHSNIPSYRVMGVRVSAATIETLHAAIDGAVRARRRFVMVSQNLHSVYLMRTNEALRNMQEKADVVRIDGMPLLWFSKMDGLPVSSENRIGWMDWMHRFMATAQYRGWRIFYVGSKDSVKDEALRKLTGLFPDLRIEGVGGYFDAEAGGEQSRNIISRAHEYGADVLLVGMGMPRQEQWIYDHLDSINVPVLLTCGAAMDYIAGVQAKPPRWMGRIGLEWLFRLLANPKRMWFRYLVEPWYAIGMYVRSRIQRERG